MSNYVAIKTKVKQGLSLCDSVNICCDVVFLDTVSCM